MSLLSLDIKFKVCWYQVLLCVNIINLLFWRPLILGRVPVYCAPPVLSCPVPVQLYLDLPHYSPGYSPLTTRYSVQFADCKHIFILYQLLSIFIIHGISMIFKFSHTRSRLRLGLSEFCSDTDLEVSEIIWNLGKWFTFPGLISKQFQCHAS